MIGGNDKNNQKSPDILQYDFDNRCLKKVANLIYPRSSHSLVYLNGCIYIINGIGEDKIVLNTME